MKPAISPSRTQAIPFLLAIGRTLPARSAGPALYVSNEVANTLSVISPQTNSVVATIAVGKRPRGLAASPDRRTVYVALGQDDALVLFATVQVKPAHTVTLAPRPGATPRRSRGSGASLATAPD